MASSIDDRLAEIFRVVFDLSPDIDPRSVRQGTTKAWDSLGHVSLVTAIESDFGVEIHAGASLELTSFEAAERLVRELAGAER